MRKYTNFFVLIRTKNEDQCHLLTALLLLFYQQFPLGKWSEHGHNL